MQSGKVYGLAVFAALLAWGFAGCGDDKELNSSSASTSSSGTGPAGSSGASSGSSSSGPVLCADVAANQMMRSMECETCLVSACCFEVEECAVRGNCIGCSEKGGPACDDAAIEAADGLLNCSLLNCKAACIVGLTPDCAAPVTAPSNGSCVAMVGEAPFTCNPVTGMPCDTGNGHACDFNFQNSSLVCYAPPNTKKTCEVCGTDPNSYCSPGNTCVGGQCARFCCDDNDCSATGKCEPAALEGLSVGFSFGGKIGVCVSTATGQGGAGGMGMGGSGGMGTGGMGMGGAGGAGGN